MREKRGLFIYLAGAVMMTISVFLPYLRYKFVMEGLIEYKESYNLINVKNIQNDFPAHGNVSIVTRMMIYLLLAAGILGIVMAIFQLLSHTNDLSFGGMILTVLSPLAGLVAKIVIANNKVLKRVSEIIHGHKAEMLKEGFSGSSGYGLGYWLLLAGLILLIVGLILYLVDTWNS